MKKVLSLMRKAIEDFNMIQERDKIAVGLSGGKDSLTLLTALVNYQKFSPQKFELIAITIDQTNGKTNFSPLINHCNELGIKLDIVKTEIFDVIFNKRKEKNPCSLCAKMRRGSLNSRAKELGCNKVALAHHSDDLIETFFLSLFYEGRLSTFSPVTYLSNVDITVIRPMLYINENIIKQTSKNLPVIENICPANHLTKREDIKEIMKKFEENFPNAKKQVLNAITHPERYNLFDKKIINKK
ncbi:MAG: ATP-binding protein [Candidatus ainarchaeum sp.]|nr:ATP-binding protein [Candidatus ainarchaeum sp.]